MTSANFTITQNGKLTDRKVSISTSSAGRVAPEESIVVEGKRYVAGSKGGILSIRDGQLVLKGMKETKF